MSVKNARIWRHYSDEILALSEKDSNCLYRYIRRARLSGSVYAHYELLDFQRYRKYQRKSRIVAFFQMTEEEQRFRFLIGKN